MQRFHLWVAKTEWWHTPTEGKLVATQAETRYQKLVLSFLHAELHHASGAPKLRGHVVECGLIVLDGLQGNVGVTRSSFYAE